MTIGFSRGQDWLHCPAVDAKLVKVEAMLDACVTHPDPLITDINGYLVRAGGKRLRPALLLLAAHCGDFTAPQLVSVAAAVELLHTATLYHDDVVDQALSRRHRPSVNACWGSQAAVFAGSCLLASATRLFAEAGDAVNALVSAALVRVWNGQCREVENSFNLDLSEAVFLQIIEEKTAAVCELACALGVRLGGVTAPQGDALTAFGRELGIAFQLSDDVMDLICDEQQLGKPCGSDLSQGSYTLPVILTLAAAGDDARRLRQVLAAGPASPDQTSEAAAILRGNGSIEKTVAYARTYCERARQRLAVLTDYEARVSLQGLVDFVESRVDKVRCDPLQHSGNA